MSSKPPFFAQERSDTCMLACLRMILAFVGSTVSEVDLAEQVNLDEGGLDPEALGAQLASRHGLRAGSSSNSSWRTLRALSH